MHKTNKKAVEFNDRLAVSSETLAQLLDCGRNSAIQLGKSANAEIRIGKRLLFNVRKIQQHLDKLSATV